MNSPKDAIRAFLQGNIDYLAIGDFLLRHLSRQEREKLADFTRQNNEVHQPIHLDNFIQIDYSQSAK